MDMKLELGPIPVTDGDRAKAVYADRLRNGAIESPHATDRMYQRVLTETGADPLPYGIEPNRKTLEAFLRWGHEQGVCKRLVDVDEMFPDSLHSTHRV